VWPDELAELVYVFVRIDMVKRRRQRAAVCLTRHVLARLTRRWFVMRARPWLWQGRALLWPHPVAMRVSWDAMRAAHPGSKIFGQSVRPHSAWQHMLVASVHRGEPFLGMTPPSYCATGFVGRFELQRRGSVHMHYLLRYML
jgi:hypothetical protein